MTHFSVLRCTRFLAEPATCRTRDKVGTAQRGGPEISVVPFKQRGSDNMGQRVWRSFLTG